MLTKYRELIDRVRKSAGNMAASKLKRKIRRATEESPDKARRLFRKLQRHRQD